MPERPPRSRLRPLAGVGLALAAGLGAFLRTRPPSPAPASAPLERFSAVRAHAVLARILGPGLPHPEGSREAENVRARIASEFRALGDRVENRRDFVCGPNGACGDVVNLVVRRAGAAGGKAILFTAHSDSVAAGPGASDDGTGVAALLEVARALSRSPTRRPLVFLIDDGEEQGLLGAEAFASAHDLPREFLADVNVEARGTTGPSILFETSENNAWLARLFGALPHPYASSLFYFVYKTLPNDTDLTVLRAHGAQGVNFGCIGGVSRYHTPRDDLAHADLATLQHHGDNVLAIARALDAVPGDEMPGGNAVFFDVFGAAVVRWPEGATLPGACAVSLLLAAGLFRLFRRRTLTAARFAAGLAIFPAASALGAAGAAIVSALLRRAGALPAGWIAHPLPAAASAWAAALAGSIAVAGWLARRAGSRNAEAGVAAVWVAVSLLLAAKAPGASYLFLIPAALMAGALIGDPVSNPAARACRLGAAIAAAFFFVPVAAVLLDAIGFRGIFATGALLGIVTTAFPADLAGPDAAPGRRIPALLALVSAGAFVAALLVAPFTRDEPRRASILLAADADSGTARWLVETDADALPAGLRGAERFRLEPEFPWFPRDRAFASPAPPPFLSPPEWRLREDRRDATTHRLTGTLVSPRGASSIRIAFPPDSGLLAITIGGKLVAPLPEAIARRGGGWRSYRVVTLPAEGMPIEIVARPGPLTFLLADRSGDLPATARALVAARPDSAVPSHAGDGTVVTRRVRL